MTSDAGGWLITDRLFGIAERDGDRELVGGSGVRPLHLRRDRRAGGTRRSWSSGARLRPWRRGHPPASELDALSRLSSCALGDWRRHRQHPVRLSRARGRRDPSAHPRQGTRRAGDLSGLRFRCDGGGARPGACVAGANRRGGRRRHGAKPGSRAIRITAAQPARRRIPRFIETGPRRCDRARLHLGDDGESERRRLRQQCARRGQSRLHRALLPRCGRFGSSPARPSVTRSDSPMRYA